MRVPWFLPSFLPSRGKLHRARWEYPGQEPARGGLEVNGRSDRLLAFNHHGDAGPLRKRRILETHPNLAGSWIVSKDVLGLRVFWERTDCALPPKAAIEYKKAEDTISVSSAAE